MRFKNQLNNILVELYIMYILVFKVMWKIINLHDEIINRGKVYGGVLLS